MPDEIFNWNGFQSAEPPGIELWRWSRSAARSSDELIENALRRAEDEVRTRVHEYPDPESYGEAQYYHVEEPASYARSGLFCQLVGSFEFSLLVLCNDASLASGSPQAGRIDREIVLSRLRYLDGALGTTFVDASEEVVVLTRLRNAFAHSDGMPPERDVPSIENWIRRHPELAEAAGGAVRLKEGFVKHCIMVYDNLLKDISIAIVAKMRERRS